MSRPFLLLSTRGDQHIADDEYRGFSEHGGFADGELVRHQLNAEPMPVIDFEAWSGIILGGSPYNASDPWGSKSDDQRRAEAELFELVDRVMGFDFPFFGACYGVGVLGSRLGGVIDGTYAEKPTAVPLHLTEAGADDPLLDGMASSFHGIVGHKEAMTRLPDGAELLVSGDACPVQMFRMRTNVYATQFHPELDVEGLTERLAAYRGHGYFDDHEVDGLIAQAESVELDASWDVLRRFADRYRR